MEGVGLSVRNIPCTTSTYLEILVVCSFRLDGLKQVGIFRTMPHFYRFLCNEWNNP